MSYVQRVLQPGEQVRRTAAIHWIVYMPAVLFLLLMCIALGYAGFDVERRRFWEIIAGLFLVIAILLFVREWFTWWTTEIAVTNLRVIYKTGFIRRQTNEMNMEKVESVRVDQSIFGRLLDYGDVSIIGTGEGGIGRHVHHKENDRQSSSASKDELRRIAKPIELRNSITGV